MTGGTMTWLLNGRTYQENDVASNEIVQLNTTEVWELVNSATVGGMMGGMSMIHPLHIHGLQFQVIERQVASQFAGGWETVRHGYVDEGWNDTVMTMPGGGRNCCSGLRASPGCMSITAITWNTRIRG
jgi:FtsP/CotA-like multicopper oxidase with cupredoxin domain